MCGLVGLISRKSNGFYHADMQLMQNLLLLDQIRGEDSTGVFTVMRDGNLRITKVGSHPAHLFTTASWTKHRQAAISDGRIMIGHNRKATMGGINSANAHPFHEENIVLVHNGTLRGGHKKLADVEVDSHAVCHAFAEQGAEAVIKTLDAAFAFIWWDIEKQRLFAVRNNERPLHIVTTEDYHILCSEAWMAEALLRRDNKKIVEIVEIPAGRLYEFQINGTYSSRDVEIKRYTTATNQNFWQGGTYMGRGAWDDVEDDLPGKPVVPSTTPNVSTSGTAKTDLVVSTTQTPFEKAAAEVIKNQSCALVAPPDIATPFATHPEYAKGEEVLLKILQSERVPSGDKIKVSGTIVEPGKSPVDFVGFLPGEATNDYVVDLMEGECMGTIRGFSNSVCGASAWISGIEKAAIRKVHNTDVAAKVWHYVYKNVMCSSCASPICANEAEFTSVMKQKKNEYRVKCADCVENTIPEGELRNVFTKRRLDALQAAKSISGESAGSSVNLAKTNSSPTLH